MPEEVPEEPEEFKEEDDNQESETTPTELPEVSEELATEGEAPAGGQGRSRSMSDEIDVSF